MPDGRAVIETQKNTPVERGYFYLYVGLKETVFLLLAFGVLVKLDFDFFLEAGIVLS